MKVYVLTADYDRGNPCSAGMPIGVFPTSDEAKRISWEMTMDPDASPYVEYEIEEFEMAPERPVPAPSTDFGESC